MYGKAPKVFTISFSIWLLEVHYTYIAHTKRNHTKMEQYKYDVYVTLVMKYVFFKGKFSSHKTIFV